MSGICKICLTPLPLDAHHATKLCDKEECDKENRAQLSRKSSLKYLDKKKDEAMSGSLLRMKPGHKHDMWFVTEPLLKGRYLIIKIFYNLQKCIDYVREKNLTM